MGDIRGRNVSFQGCIFLPAGISRARGVRSGPVPPAPVMVAETASHGLYVSARYPYLLHLLPGGESFVVRYVVWAVFRAHRKFGGLAGFGTGSGPLALILADGAAFYRGYVSNGYSYLLFLLSGCMIFVVQCVVLGAVFSCPQELGGLGWIGSGPGPVTPVRRLRQQLMDLTRSWQSLEIYFQSV